MSGATRTPVLRRRTRLVAGAVVLGVASLLAAGTASGQEPAAVGWWWSGGGTGLPVSPPTVPDGGLYVAGTDSTPTGVSAVTVELSSLATGTVLTLALADNGLQGSPVVWACPITSPWSPEQGGPVSSAPPRDCANPVRGVLSSDASTMSFALPASSGHVVDVALVPGVDAAATAPTAFSASFAKPGKDAFSAIVPPITPPTPRPSVPTASPVAQPTHGSKVPQVLPTGALSGWTPETTAPTAEPTQVSPPVTAPGPTVAVPTHETSSRPLSPRGLVLLLALASVVALGLYRRSYQPRGSFLDVLMGKRTAAALEDGSVSPLFERVWRGVVWGGALALVWYGAARQLPSGVPPGIVLYGVVVGAVTGVLALGVILVYRTNRVINFAQAAFGSVALVLTFELTYQWHLPYFVSAVIGIALAAGLAGGAELGVMRRFREAPRLIVTLGTIGLANVFLFLQVIIVVLFERNAEKTAVGSVFYPSPLNHPVFRLSGMVFTGDVVLAMVVVPVVLVAMVRFLQGSWLGMGLRASAENADRASTLAVPVGRLSTLSWVIAGVLSAVATLLRAPITGYSLSSASTTGFLAILLTAVVLGKLENLALCFFGAIGIGVVDQVYFYNYGRGSHLDTIHLVWILGALLLYAKPRGRAVWNELSSWKAFREVRPIAPELARVPLVRLGRVAVPALVLGVVALFPLVVHGFAAIRLATLMGIWAIAALSLVVLTGWGGHISLGQWSIVGFGAFVAGRMLSWHHQPSIVVVLVAASAAGGLIAALLGIPAFRLRGIYLAVITFAFAAAAYSLLFTVSWLVPSGPIVRPPALRSERSVFYLVLVLLTLCVLALRNIRRSRLGRILVAARDNEVAVMSFGVNLLRARAASFILSGGIAGLAGGLYATMNTAVRYQDFGPELSLQLFAIAVIGGLGSLSGALVGSLYIVGAAYFLPSYGPFLATGLGMLFFLLVFPGGLGQIVYGVRDAVLRRLARRLDIDSPTLTADRRATGADHLGELLVADGMDLR